MDENLKPLKPTDVMKFLDISRTTLWRRIKDGTLTTINVGTKENPRYRFPRSQFESFL